MHSPYLGVPAFILTSPSLSLCSSFLLDRYRVVRILVSQGGIFRWPFAYYSSILVDTYILWSRLTDPLAVLPLSEITEYRSRAAFNLPVSSADDLEIYPNFDRV